MSFTVAISGYSAHLRAEYIPPPQAELPDLVLVHSTAIRTAYQGFPILIHFIRMQPSPLFPSPGLAGLREEYLTPRVAVTSDGPYSVAACGQLWDIDWFTRSRLTEVQRAPAQAVIEPIWLPPWRRETVEGGVWIPECHEVQPSPDAGKPSGNTPMLGSGAGGEAEAGPPILLFTPSAGTCPGLCAGHPEPAPIPARGGPWRGERPLS